MRSRAVIRISPRYCSGAPGEREEQKTPKQQQLVLAMGKIQDRFRLFSFDKNKKYHLLMIVQDSLLGACGPKTKYEGCVLGIRALVEEGT